MQWTHADSSEMTKSLVTKVGIVQNEYITSLHCYTTPRPVSCRQNRMKYTKTFVIVSYTLEYEKGKDNTKKHVGLV